MNIMDERRTELRMMCADMVEVAWRDRVGKTRRAMALLEDISPSGACLQLETPVPVGVELHWATFKGEVRYCAYREIGYFVGVEFHPSTRWSKNNYKPQHLLDLRTLIPSGSKEEE